MGTVLVLTLLVLAVGFIIRSLVRDRKQGKHTCGGNCASCHGACSHK